MVFVRVALMMSILFCCSGGKMVDDDNNSVKPAENSPKRKLKENPPNKAEGPQLTEKVPPEKVPKNAHLSPAPPLNENSTETPPNKDYSPPKIENVSDLSKLKTLAEFGYTFNDKGEMRSVPGNVPFNFQVKPGDQHFNQKHYEALGEVLTEEVYTLLETKAGLEKRYLDSKRKESFVFVSPDFQNKEQLVCLIHGSGVVRAGQWARRLIINNDLDKGTQIPYILRSIKAGYGVVVFNTNQNTYVDDKGKTKSIPGSENPEDHAVTVWNQLISRENNIKDIFIVAHSYGGVVTVDLARQMRRDFLERVSGVFMTDSVHYGLTGRKDLDTKMKDIGVNYVTSQLPLGEPVKASQSDIKRVSAGHDKHEWTSHCAIDEIFQGIADILKKPSKLEL